MKGLYSLKIRCKQEYKWTDEFATRAIAEYEIFLNLKKEQGDFKAKILSPSFVIDQVWHLHILDTEAYRQTCGDTFVDHKPVILHGEWGEFQRAKRYYDTYNLLSPHSKLQDDIWPEPLVYVLIKGKRVSDFLLPFHKQLKKDQIKKKIEKAFPDKIVSSHVGIKLTGDLKAFGIMQWATQAIKTKSRKRTRSETQTKVIYVKDLEGITRTCYVPKQGGDAGDLMDIVWHKTAISPCRQRLVFAGQQLEPEESIDWISSESTIHLVLSLRGC